MVGWRAEGTLAVRGDLAVLKLRCNSSAPLPAAIREH